MSAGTRQVVDEEGTVDQQLKNAILRARDRVEERYDQIYVLSELEGVELDQAEKDQHWASTVRQYLVRIEPLLKSDEIPKAEEYYQNKEITTRTVTPQDGLARVVASGSARENKDAVEVDWAAILSDTSADRRRPGFRKITPPEPKKYQVNGLVDVIENSREQFTWTVDINRDPNPQRQLIVQPVRVVQLTQDELYQAVRYADEFLQHHAGISVETGHKEIDEGDDNPF